jgi:pimeloyl-ACP methyl ester carboxylesterase
VAAAPNLVAVRGVKIELIEQGAGPPLLFLHPGIGIEPDAPVLARLAARHRVLAPTHPGFGRSELPKSFDSVDDLAYFYLDLLDALDLHNVVVVGVSLGGWIAAEIAIKSSARLSHLVLANAVGIKVGDREHRDIVDIFAITDDELLALAYCDAAAGKRDYKSMPDAAVKAAARNREATARYAWAPFMHDPKLKGRLHRVTVPTLLLWGMHDRILSEAYGRAYCAAIPGARFETLAGAGHFPHVEEPEQFAEKIFAFVGAQSEQNG